MAFKDRLKQASAAAGYSQVDIAQKLKVSQPSVNAWFRGRSMPDIGRITDIATLLKVDATWLLDGTTPDPNAKRTPNFTGPGAFRSPIITPVKGMGGEQMTNPMARTAYNLLMRLSSDEAMHVIEAVIAEMPSPQPMPPEGDEPDET